MSGSARPLSDSLAVVRSMLEEATAPVTLAALAKRTRLPAAELKALLEAELERRAIHRWPDYRRQQRFWTRAAEEVLRQEVLAAAAEMAMPGSALSKQIRKKMPGHPAKLVASAIQQLVRDRELTKYAGFGREKELLGRSGYPGAYAAAGEAAIRAIRERLAAACGDLEETILKAMSQLEPSRTAPVSVRELRAALREAGKQAFDIAALNLRAKRTVFLSQHDFPQGLSAQERELLIDGQDGSYYVAITARSE